MLSHFIHWLQQTLQAYPELAIYITLSAGFFIGNLRLGKFSLGTVTAVLLVGVLVGQMHITISPNVKAVFFLLFLFMVGYSVGPQFFRGLKKDGIPQMVFSVLVCAISFIVTWLLAKLMGYNAGQGAGLLAGSQTISAVLGVASNTIGGLNISEHEKQILNDAMPVCYAVTYLFGTAGSAWLLASIGPKLLGGLERVKAQCRELEKQMGGGDDPEPNMRQAISTTTTRAYRITTASMAYNKTVQELEQEFLSQNHRIFVKRVKRGTDILDVAPGTHITEGDIIVVSGRREFVLPETNDLGIEVVDSELLNFQVKNVQAYAIHKQAIGLTVKELVLQDLMHGVIVQKITRGSTPIPLFPETRIEKGDLLELVGSKEDVDRASKHIGYAEIATEKTDLVFVGLGIALGGLFGSLAINAGNVPISLSTSGGALIGGLFFGWLRSQHPAFGQIPAPAVWVLNNIGLNVFIAVVGISSGAGFVAGLREIGLQLFFVGIIATTVPLLTGILMGRYLFKFHPALTLGCTAGARTTTAALPAIQDSLQSKLPALGYTVTYAVGSTSLIIGGIIIILLMN